ncbi:MAG: caspase family protein [Saprospiraceae bacterium]|nr:caspase family protein [Candidatus Vicinibacter affinis]
MTLPANHTTIRFCVFILLAISAIVIQAQTKKALIVAIGTYPAASEITSLHSLNDIPLIQSALSKLGFEEKDILILKDANATKQNILNGLESQLLKNVKEGDIAYFHFSGHGQQVQDFNGDESDGYDEALVPYDALMEYEPGKYQGEKHITDDELNILYKKIINKLGAKGHFLITVDACHSGTSTRGFGLARGTDIPMAPADYRTKSENKPKDFGPSDALQIKENALETLVAFFASMASQKNYEILAEDGKYYGSLSYAFSKAVNKLPKDASYLQLFDRIRLTIGNSISNQTPEASGILTQKVLGGKFQPTPEYYLAKEFITENQLEIEGGFLNGLNVGTVIGFFPPDTRNMNSIKPLATGTLIDAGSHTSLVELKDGFEKKLLDHSWGIVVEENFGNIQINLRKQGTLSNEVNEIFQNLAKIPFIKITDADADLILEESGLKILLSNKFGLEIDTWKNSANKLSLFDSIKKSITKYAQAQYLRKLNQQNRKIDLRLDFILVSRKGTKIPENYPSDSLKNEQGEIILKNGDTIRLKVSNYGKEEAFFTIIDIQPDNKMNILYPKAEESSVKLANGKSEIIPINFRISPPLGVELFRVIASRNPINLRPLDQRRSINDQPNTQKDPFEKLFLETYHLDNISTRGGTTASLPPGQVNISSTQFRIID